MVLPELRPLLILGASGQIGRALLHAVEARANSGPRAIGLSRGQADLARIPEMLAALDQLAASQAPDRPFAAVINAAAYTQVDRAESEPELAARINGEAPGALARWAAKRDIPFVHYSTDYVFSGIEGRALTENDETAPMNVYGESKLEGERSVAAAGGRYLVFRTSWIYDAQGANFVNTMLRLGRERETLSVVDDQIGAPSFAADLAGATLRALEEAVKIQSASGRFPAGIYHLTNAGETSWHGFAEAVFAEARALGAEPLKLRELRAIPSSGYPAPAPRPRNSRLSNARFREVFGFGLRPWREALHECMMEKRGS